MGVSEGWTKYNGTLFLATPPLFCDVYHLFASSTGGGPFWLAMRGYTYRRALPTMREGHPAHWFLYDAGARSGKALDYHIPSNLIEDAHLDLEEYNSLYHAYESFSQFQPEAEDAHFVLDLANPGQSNEIAALYRVGSAANKKSARAVYVQRSGSGTPTQIPILSLLYEPLQYPLFFPDGSPGWGVSFQHAARAAGLLQEDEDAITNYQSASQLHFLFVLLIVEGTGGAVDLWERFKDDLARDHLGNTFAERPPRIQEYARNRALRDIQHLLNEHNRTSFDRALLCGIN